MAESRTVNTRIILRNDNLSSWLSSQNALLKGEVALALRPDNNYEMKIGMPNDLSTWSMLSSAGQLIIDGKNIEGLIDCGGAED